MGSLIVWIVVWVVLIFFNYKRKHIKFLYIVQPIIAICVGFATFDLQKLFLVLDVVAFLNLLVNGGKGSGNHGSGDGVSSYSTSLSFGDYSGNDCNGSDGGGGSCD